MTAPTIIGTRKLLEADPRVERVMAQLEREVAEAHERARQALDRIEGTERLRPFEPAFEAEIVAHPEVYDEMVALRVLRETAKRSVASIAREIGRDRKTVARWEQGRSHRIYPRDMARYCTALGVDNIALMMVVDGITERRRKVAEA